MKTCSIPKNVNLIPLNVVSHINVNHVHYFCNVQYVGLVKKLLWYGNISNTYIMDFPYNRRPTNMKVYTFVFTKTHNTNHRPKSFLLANHERENFYFAFTEGACLPLLLWFLRLPEILPCTPRIFPCPLAVFPFFPHFFLFYFAY